MRKFNVLVVAASIMLSSFSTLAYNSNMSLQLEGLENSSNIRLEVLNKLSNSSQQDLREFILSEYGPKALARIEQAAKNGEDENMVAKELITSGAEFRNFFCGTGNGQVVAMTLAAGAAILLLSSMKPLKSESEHNQVIGVNKDADSLVSAVQSEITQLRNEGVNENSYLITSRKAEITQINIQRNAELETLNNRIATNKSRGQTMAVLGAATGAFVLVTTVPCL